MRWARLHACACEFPVRRGAVGSILAPDLRGREYRCRRLPGRFRGFTDRDARVAEPVDGRLIDVLVGHGEPANRLLVVPNQGALGFEPVEEDEGEQPPFAGSVVSDEPQPQR